MLRTLGLEARLGVKVLSGGSTIFSVTTSFLRHSYGNDANTIMHRLGYTSDTDVVQLSQLLIYLLGESGANK